MVKELSQKLIGYRVKAAREACGWTQDQLAEALELNDRQTISDIEKGKRTLKPSELIVLVEILNRELDFFLDPFQVAGEAQFSWRASPGLEENSLDSFELKAGQWIGMLRWLRVKENGSANPLKHALRITIQSSFEDAMNLAESLVAKLDLGNIPAERLTEKVEQELDIPILYVDTIENENGDSISGATCHLQDMGVILINRKETEARRFFDLAHELFHALTWDAMKPEHRESNSLENRTKVKRVEQLANNFAAALLMPKASLAHLIDNRFINEVEHLVDVATQLRVTPQALAWRLFNLNMIDAAIKDSLLQAPHNRASISRTPKRFSPSFVGMLHKAIDMGHLSARKAARSMGASLAQLQELFSEHSMNSPFEL